MSTPVRLTYTAQRSSYLTSLSVLLFMLLVEGGALCLILPLFIPNLLLKFMPAALYLILLVAILLRLLAPLFTHHSLKGDELHLHYGRSLNVTLPLSDIAAIEPVRERLAMFASFQAQYDQRKQRLVAALSEHGLLLIRLRHPCSVKLGRRTVEVTSLLINLDKPEELMEEFQRGTSANTGNVRQYGSQGSGQSKRRPYSRGQLIATERLGAALAPPPISSDATIAIQTHDLTRTFASFTAVESLNLAIRRGEIYGFLGSNGAGKTTTIKMLAGLLEPSSGQALLDGHDVWQEPLQAKAALGYVADRAILYERLTAREFLHFLAQLRRIPQKEASQRIEDLLKLLELDTHANRPCGAYSFGMKRKLSLAGALLHRPSVLILDEPLNGLDPRSTRRLKDLFLELAAQGTTILLSTHDLATAESICHRVGIFHRGRLLAEGTAAELRQMASASDLEAVFLTLTSEQPEEVLL